jgi:hypothetical protein
VADAERMRADKSAHVSTLVFCAGAGSARRAGRDSADRRLVAWDGRAEQALRAAGLSFKTTADYLGRGQDDELDEAAMAWVKAFGRAPLVDGQTFRQLAQWQGVSLWWFAELYLYHDTRVPHAVRLIETVERVLAAELPGEVEAAGLSLFDEILIGRVCTALGILFHGRHRPPRLALAERSLRVSLAGRWNNVKGMATAVKARLSGAAPTPPSALTARTVLFLSHAAFWRTRRDAASGKVVRYEHYFDRLIPEVDASAGLRAFTVAVGPTAAFKRRRLSHCIAEWLRPHCRTAQYVHINRYLRPSLARRILAATREIRELLDRLARSSGVQAALTHHDVRFGDLVAPDLRATLLLQLPWAVRSMLQVNEVLRVVGPSVLCLYAESSGWGRAALAACRAAGVRTLALQHGILYPKYFSLRHDADEGECPRPDLTAVYGESARRLLMGIGRYAPESLVATGSLKFDDLARAARQWDTQATCARWKLRPGDRLLVVASRFRAIRDTCQALGPVFADLVRAIGALPDVVCLVKPHPAESAAPYEAVLRTLSVDRVRLVPSGADLMELMHAADALVTVESSSAVEALILAKPVVILNLPTHLGELVNKGVALGVAAGDDPLPVLRAALEDAATLERLSAARARYLDDLTMGADGGATQRILKVVGQAAQSGSHATVRTA